MKILVTGGCGFIGAGFCRRMIHTFPFLKIVNIDCLYPCSTKASDLITNAQNYTFLHGNICNTNLLLSTFVTHDIDTVIHFAAQSHVDTSFTNSFQYTKDNIMGTHSLLEAMRLYGKIKRFLHISTDEVYGENTHTEQSAKTEESLLKPSNPYAATKVGAEMLVHSYMYSYNLPAIILRANNVYGPGQYHEKVIPKFILQLLQGKPVTIQGSGSQLRSFLHLEDMVDAVLFILYQGEIRGIYNVSSVDEVSVSSVAERLIRLIYPTDSVKTWISYVEDRNYNDKRYWTQSEKLRALGWHQKISFDRGLRETLTWFQTVDTNTYWCDLQPIRSVLFWGSKGWIGTQFKQLLQKKGWSVYDARSRADCQEDVRKEIEEYRPTHIVSMIGRTHGPGFATIDYLEPSEKLCENIQDNLYAPLVLGLLAKEYGIHYTYLGTGCIFEFDKEHTIDNEIGFDEQEKPNFTGSKYSVVKGFTDQLMHLLHDSCLNVRIRMPISSQDNPRNFITKIIQYTRICSIPNSMTVLDDMLPILEQCMQKKIVGTLNAVNPGTIDHDTILDMYKTFQNPDHVWDSIPVSTLEKTCVVGRRSNNRLSTQRLQELFPSIPSIHDSVRTILQHNAFAGRTKVTGSPTGGV
jgi:UDP-glucose 4,6-dehydratase